MGLIGKNTIQKHITYPNNSLNPPTTISFPLHQLYVFFFSICFLFSFQNHNIHNIQSFFQSGARKEDESCLTFTYGSESKLSGSGVSTSVKMGEFNLTVDEPKAFPGGTNAGPNPLDLMCASLGTCQEITYKLYATVMDIPMNSVSAKVTGDINLSGFVGVGEKIGFSGVAVEITIDAPDASDEQLNMLKGAVDAHCPLVASLVNPLALTTTVVKIDASSGSSNPSDNLKEGVMALVSAAKEGTSKLYCC